MYFGEFFFHCVHYSVVSNYSNTGIEIFYVYIAIYQQLQICCSCVTKKIFLRGIYFAVHINIMLLSLFVQILFVQNLFASPLVFYVKLNFSSHPTF